LGPLHVCRNFPEIIQSRANHQPLNEQRTINTLNPQPQSLLQHLQLARVPLFLLYQHAPLPLLFRTFGIGLAFDLIQLLLDRGGLFFDFGEGLLQVCEGGLEVRDYVSLGVDIYTSAQSQQGSGTCH
jgi:hypothetical protein